MSASKDTLALLIYDRLARGNRSHSNLAEFHRVKQNFLCPRDLHEPFDLFLTTSLTSPARPSCRHFHPSNIQEVARADFDSARDDEEVLGQMMREGDSKPIMWNKLINFHDKVMQEKFFTFSCSKSL